MSFWDDLYLKNTLVVGLSPMDGVTDAAMRYMTAKYGSRVISNPKFSNSQIGGVNLLFTEFVSVDALYHASPERRERLLKTFIRARDVAGSSGDTVSQLHGDTAAAPRRWPYEIAQVFGTKPDLFVEAAKLIESLGFDGIDINMGCPAHKVEENGSGAGLIRTPELAKEIILAVKSATTLPVSVKTRIGVDKDVSEWWMGQLMEVKPANISLHGRTLRQLYQGSADWDSIGRAAKVVHAYGGHILGNGDILSMADLEAKAGQYGVDGGLVGRAAEGNPGIFNSQITNDKFSNEEPSMEQRKAWMLEHARIFERIFAERVDLSKSELSTLRDQPSKSFMPMRKHLAWYCKGFPGAVEVRSKLMQTNNSKEVEEIVTGIM